MSGKHISRHEEWVPEQSKTGKLRASLLASTGVWKSLVDVEELLKNISAS
jgi:hypothetical protein